MEFDRIFGWVLLFSGVLIVSATLFYSYNILQGKYPLPEIFKINKIQEKSITASEKNFNDVFQLSQQILTEIVSKEISSFFQVEFLPKFLNLISFSFFAGIFIFGGSQIASLGIKMIKK